MLSFVVGIFESIGYQTILDVLLLSIMSFFVIVFLILRYINTRSDVVREREISRLESLWKTQMEMERL